MDWYPNLCLELPLIHVWLMIRSTINYSIKLANYCSYSKILILIPHSKTKDTQKNSRLDYNLTVYVECALIDNTFFKNVKIAN